MTTTHRLADDLYLDVRDREAYRTLAEELQRDMAGIESMVARHAAGTTALRRAVVAAPSASGACP